MAGAAFPIIRGDAVPPWTRNHPPTRREFIAATAALTVSPWTAGLRLQPDQDQAQERAGIAKAMDAVRAAIPLASSDPERPIYHFGPPANWNNDPNGTLFYKGWHHLFYQLNPFGTVGGNQHWGHARSRDLVNWDHLPIAIAPSFDKGERAIYSGAAIVAADGRPRVLYTSIGDRAPEQWLAMPEDEDLIRWTKFSGNPVLTMAAHGSVVVDEWRDPFLFSEAGHTYMVCGGNVTPRHGGAGQVQLYRATRSDLSEWKHLGAVFQALERETFNIECPNLFRLDGKWVIITSPHRACEYYVGALDLDACRFVPETHGILDPGDAYASNISVDDRGRTILWLWGRTNTPAGRGWNGVMVMPRILAIAPDGTLRQDVPAEFASLRGPVKTFPDLVLSGGPQVLDDVRGDAVEVNAEFAVNGSAAFGFEVRPSPSAAPTMVVTMQHGTLTAGQAKAYVGAADRYALRLFLDKRCMEVYVNDGAAAVYVALEAAPATRAVAVFARGRSDSAGEQADRNPPVRLLSLRAWPMSAASFSLDRFHA
jgi:beta-fructofuranosidase